MARAFNILVLRSGNSARGKSWDEFSANAAPPALALDFIFAVRGNAVAETCPV